MGPMYGERLRRPRRAWRALAVIGAPLVVVTACSLMTQLDAPTGPLASGDSSILDGALGDATLVDASIDAGPFDACGAPDACPDGPPPFYAALFISQSFPLATSALTMVEGQVIPSYIQMQNIGDTAWDTNTELGTTDPRNRNSLFADATWPSWPDAGNRASAMTSNNPVVVGGSYKFQFDLAAPQVPGTYYEHFGLVNGSIWFGDKDQGGPADDDIEAQIVVIAPEYRGTPSAQTFPVSPATQTVASGSTVSGSFSLTNTGTDTWVAGTVKLAPIPRDPTVAPPFYDSSWLSISRISSVSADVAPGSVGTFGVTLNASSAIDAGTYTVKFGLVEEGVTWFADPTLGGGPPDGTLRVDLVVTP